MPVEGVPNIKCSAKESANVDDQASVQKESPRLNTKEAMSRQNQEYRREQAEANAEKKPRKK